MSIYFQAQVGLTVPKHLSSSPLFIGKMVHFMPEDFALVPRPGLN